VRLDVRDLAGRHVATLTAGLRGAGWHTANWQGRDDAGRLVPSGAYSCRLETRDGVATHKLVLLK
jgi:flagellar hook assembly protein FlgD